MDTNAYYVELMFTLLSIFQPEKLMKTKYVEIDLIFEEKRKKAPPPKKKRTKRQNRTNDRSNHSIKQIDKLQTLRTKTTLILKPIKTNYKTWTFFVKIVKRTLNVHIQHPKILVLISNKKGKVKSKCAECLTDRTFFDKTSDEYDLQQLVKHFFSLLMYFIKDNEDLLHKVQKQY